MGYQLDKRQTEIKYEQIDLWSIEVWPNLKPLFGIIGQKFRCIGI